MVELIQRESDDVALAAVHECAAEEIGQGKVLAMREKLDDLNRARDERYRTPRAQRESSPVVVEDGSESDGGVIVVDDSQLAADAAGVKRKERGSGADEGDAGSAKKTRKREDTSVLKALYTSMTNATGKTCIDGNYVCTLFNTCKSSQQHKADLKMKNVTKIRRHMESYHPRTLEHVDTMISQQKSTPAIVHSALQFGATFVLSLADSNLFSCRPADCTVLLSLQTKTC